MSDDYNEEELEAILNEEESEEDEDSISGFDDGGIDSSPIFNEKQKSTKPKLGTNSCLIGYVCFSSKRRPSSKPRPGPFTLQ